MNHCIMDAMNGVSVKYLNECEEALAAGYLPKEKPSRIPHFLAPLGYGAVAIAFLAVIAIAPEFLPRKPTHVAGGTTDALTDVASSDMLTESEMQDTEVQGTETTDYEDRFDFSGIPDDLKEAFLEAYAALNWLDADMIEQLEQDYSKQTGDAAGLGGLSLNVQPGEVLLGGIHCYGVFEDCIVILVPTILNAIGSGTVAGERFTYPTLFYLYGYHDGVFYSLREAYEKGYISQEEVALAAKRHRAVWRYHLLLTHSDTGPMMTPSGPVYFTETTEKEETME